MKKRTTEEFIKQAKEIHGDKYIYRDVEYKKSTKKVKIICPIHGAFFQLPGNHLKYGCKECGHEKASEKKKMPRDKLIEEFKEQHGEKYNYDKVVYKGSDSLVEIVCPVHGSFWKLPSCHKYGQGCPKCSYDRSSIERTLDTATVVQQFKDIHSDFYDYSKVVYVSAHEPVTIICPIHGNFEQSPNNHKRGYGCPKCASHARGIKSRLDKEEILKRFKDTHGDKYDYSRVKCESSLTPVEIICPDHGSFWQSPSVHISGHGCPVCGYESAGEKRRKTTNDVIEQFRTVHGDTYDYNNVDYVGNITDVIVTCPVHGDFFQTPSNHIAGKGCRKCTQRVSRAEKELVEYIESVVSTISVSDRTKIPPYELDIYAPEHKLAIEYNGLYWHSTACKANKNYHLDKTLACEKQGIRLIHIYEDEWQQKPKRVKSMILNALGKGDGRKINARQCTIDEIPVSTAKAFCDSNHIQGYVGASIRLGLFHNDELVAYMGLSLRGKKHDLNRYCTSANVRGGFSKLLKYFQRTYEWSEIFTYAERRYSNGDLYRANGFAFEYATRPGYDYIKGVNRYSRQHFMKHKLNHRIEKFNPDLTEEQNMTNNGYYRIYNCGVYRFSIKK